MGEAPAPVAADAEKAAPGWKAWVAAGAVAAVVAVGAAFVLGNGSDSSSADTAAGANANANANGALPGGYGQFPGGGRLNGMGTAGTVSATDGSTLTVTSTQDDTKTTVKTTDDTVVTKSSDGELSDLAVGDNVVAMGQTTGDTVAAQRIIDSGDVAATTGFGGGPGGGTPPAGVPDGGVATDGRGPGGELPDGQAPPTGGTGMPGAPTAGEITKIDGDTITVKNADGATLTITTSSDTVVSVTETIEVGDIAKGDTVIVQGETADDVVTATSIRVGDLDGGFQMGGGTPPNGGPNGGGAGGAGGPGTDTSNGGSSGGSTSNSTSGSGTITGT